MRLLVATCRILPEPDPDQQLLLDELVGAGIDAGMAAWDDPEAPWGRADVVLLRSTWDYHHRPAEFLAWARRVAARSRLLNPLRVVEWNLHKRYLLDLQGGGIPIVPTRLLERGAGDRLAPILDVEGWVDVVIKPAVSASSFRTRRFRSGALDAGEAHLAALQEERDVLVQAYMASVETTGERALIWVAGEFTHAVRKEPRLMGQDEAVSEAVPIAPEERELGERVLGRFPPGELLYARVDVARDGAGTVRLMELELIEPSLFLAQHPPALGRLVRALRSS